MWTEIKLASLAPLWLERVDKTSGRRNLRYGVGISILCPGHLGRVPECRLELPFLNPNDGLPHGERLGCVMFGHEGTTLDQLSIWVERPTRSKLISFPGHWCGVITCGGVVTLGTTMARE